MKRKLALIIIVCISWFFVTRYEAAYSTDNEINYEQLNRMVADVYQKLDPNKASTNPLVKTVDHLDAVATAWKQIGVKQLTNLTQPVSREQVATILTRVAQDPEIITGNAENEKFKEWTRTLRGYNPAAAMTRPEVQKGLDLVYDTEKYIRDFDPARYEKEGADYTNPVYSPLRLGKPFDELTANDYDFEQLAQVEKSLENVDRRRALLYIFSDLTQSAPDNYSKHLAILDFLQHISNHNDIQPMYPNKNMVSDPLVLLELAEMRCGQVARMAVDLFAAAGYQARLVQLGEHVIAEIYYDGSWHYLDADIFGGGALVVSNGKIPSVDEMSKNPFVIDSVPNNLELHYQGRPANTIIYPSWNYFNKEAYKSYNYEAMYYYKTATVAQEFNNIYGWNYYTKVTDKERVLSTFPRYYQPTYPVFSKIEAAGGKVLIEWRPRDVDNDLLGFKVFVSSQSRNWDYSEFMGDEELKPYWANPEGWKPEMYEKLYEIPPSDKGLLETKTNSISLDLEKGQTYYITVMPYDKHGESVGKKLYTRSNELKITT